MFFTNFKVWIFFLFFPMLKMKETTVDEYLKDIHNRNFCDEGERLLKVYDNTFCSFLLTNVRIIGIGKLKNREDRYLISDIFTIPLFQLGTFRVFTFRFPSFNAVSITTSPGFTFYWFFHKSVDMRELSNMISRVVSDVQGVSSIQKL